MNDIDPPSSKTPSGAPSPAHEQLQTQAQQRLERLEGFLREDPANDALMADAFDTALRCGAWERAQFQLTHARHLQPKALAWRLREAHFWLAQQRDDLAEGVLAALADIDGAPASFRDAVLHDRALIDTRRGDWPSAVERLAPHLDVDSADSRPTSRSPATTMPRATSNSPTLTLLQQLWLRALHHAGRLDQAMAWARRVEASQRLMAPHVAGVASLIALDQADFEAARRWSAEATSPAVQPPLPEAEVVRASLALADLDADGAVRIVQALLDREPGEGRARSVLGFAALLKGDFGVARSSFELAVGRLPGHVGTWHGLAWACLQGGDMAAARQAFESALALDRNFAESHGGLAVVLALTGERVDAQAEAALALRLDLANLSGRYAAALLDGQVKDARDVQRLARRLVAGRVSPGGVDLSSFFGDGRDADGDRGKA